jgi:hypothetical protein
VIGDFLSLFVFTLMILRCRTRGYETSIILNGSNSANESINYGLMSANFTDSQPTLVSLSGHVQNITLELTEDSEFYKAYIITAVLTLTSAIPFLVLLCDILM